MRKLLSLGYSSLLRWLWLLRDYRRLKDFLALTHGVGKVRPVLAHRWHRLGASAAHGRRFEPFSRNAILQFYGRIQSGGDEVDRR